MYIDQVYTGFITLTEVKVQKGHTFSKQTLFIYNEDEICVLADSQMVSGELE